MDTRPDEGGTEAGREAQVDREALLEAKDETIRILEEQLRLRGEEVQLRDVVISQLTQANAALAAKVQELEAPQELPGSSQSAGAESVREVTPPAGESAREGGEPRSRWWRVFGG